MQERPIYTVKIHDTLIFRDTPTTYHVYATHCDSQHTRVSWHTCP